MGGKRRKKVQTKSELDVNYTGGYEALILLFDLKEELCPVCNGTGVPNSKVCEFCRGAGIKGEYERVRNANGLLTAQRR